MTASIQAERTKVAWMITCHIIVFSDIAPPSGRGFVSAVVMNVFSRWIEEMPIKRRGELHLQNAGIHMRQPLRLIGMPCKLRRETNVS